jgi:hypothetical protein
MIGVFFHNNAKLCLLCEMSKVKVMAEETKQKHITKTVEKDLVTHLSHSFTRSSKSNSYLKNITLHGHVCYFIK